VWLWGLTSCLFQLRDFRRNESNVSVIIDRAE
jgi:hypothetical protein